MANFKNNDQTVYISNLSYHRDEKGIQHLFSRYGKILSIKIIIDLKTHKSKGMAFVEMASRDEAEKAILGLNQQIIDSRTMKVSFAIFQKTTGGKHGQRIGKGERQGQGKRKEKINYQGKTRQEKRKK